MLETPQQVPTPAAQCKTLSGKSLPLLYRGVFRVVFNKLVFKKPFEMRDEASTAEAADAHPSSLGYPVDKWM